MVDASRPVFFLPFFRPPPFSVLCPMLFAAFSLSWSHSRSEPPFAALPGGGLVFISLPLFPKVRFFIFFSCSPLCVAHCFVFLCCSFPLNGLTLTVRLQTLGKANICATLEPRGIWVVISRYEMIETDLNSILSSLQPVQIVWHK